MKIYCQIIFVMLTVFLFNHSSFAQKGKTPVKPKRATAQAVGKNDAQMNYLGTVEGSEYKNSFFGLKINVPANWIIQEREVNETLKQIGGDGVKGKTRKIQKSLDQSFQKVTILLTATKDIIGMPENAVFALTVEKPSPPVRFRNGSDYLRLALQSYKLMQLPADYKYSENIQSETFAGEKFYYIDVQRTGFTQRFYATAKKGCAVFFLAQYFNAEDLETMKDILRNSDFSWKG